MNSLAMISPALPPTPPDVMAKIAAAQEKCALREQTPIQTDHVIHAGMYARTITMPPDVVLIGTLIKIPTTVITVGSASVLVGDEWMDVDGYRVIPALPGRKQVFLSRGPFIVTMIFPTSAATVEEAEKQFTDETAALLSRMQGDMNTVTITGEQ
jgi:hypothetical protein